MVVAIDGCHVGHLFCEKGVERIQSALYQTVKMCFCDVNFSLQSLVKARTRRRNE